MTRCTYLGLLLVAAPTVAHLSPGAVGQPDRGGEHCQNPGEDPVAGWHPSSRRLTARRHVGTDARAPPQRREPPNSARVWPGDVRSFPRGAGRASVEREPHPITADLFPLA